MHIQFEPNVMKSALTRLKPLFHTKGVNGVLCPEPAVRIATDAADNSAVLSAYISNGAALETRIALRKVIEPGECVASLTDLLTMFKDAAGINALRKSTASPTYFCYHGEQAEDTLNTHLTGEALADAIFPTLAENRLPEQAAFYKADFYRACKFSNYAAHTKSLDAQLDSVLFSPTPDGTEVVATNQHQFAMRCISPTVPHPFHVPAFLVKRVEKIFGANVDVFNVAVSKTQARLRGGDTQLILLDSERRSFPNYTGFMPQFETACHFEIDRVSMIHAITFYEKAKDPLVRFQVSADTLSLTPMADSTNVYDDVAATPVQLPTTLTYTAGATVYLDAESPGGEPFFQFRFQTSKLLETLKAFSESERLTLVFNLARGPLGVRDAATPSFAKAKAMSLLMPYV